MPLELGIWSCAEAEYDRTQEISDTMEAGSTLSTVWVKAHQDNNTAAKLLTLDACLNIQADADATAFCPNTPDNLSNRSQPIMFPAVRAQILINDIFITGQLQKWICNNYTGLTCQLMTAINWKKLGTALERQKTSLQNLLHQIYAQLAQHRPSKTEILQRCGG
eukprot:4080666-Ditylum_brightwellii.AAC.1